MMHNPSVRITFLVFAVGIIILVLVYEMCADENKLEVGIHALEHGIDMASHDDRSQLGIKCIVKKDTSELHCNFQKIGIIKHSIEKIRNAIEQRSRIEWVLPNVSENISELELRKAIEERLKTLIDNREKLKKQNLATDIFQTEEKYITAWEEQYNCILKNIKDSKKLLKCLEPIKKMRNDVLYGQ